MRYPTLESALAAPAGALDDLVLSHGLSPSYRPRIWLAHAAATRVRCGLSPTVDYASLVGAGAVLELEVSRQIELDLPRTFPEQRDFAAALAMKNGAFDGSRSSALAAAEAANEPHMYVPGAGDVHDAVRRLLRAFCAAHPATGYLQSMNFLAAFILLVFGRGSEGEAYTVFETLVLCNLRGYYTPDMSALHADCGLITALLRARMPRLIAHLDRLGLPDVGALFLPRWLLCSFLNCFASDLIVRLWDAMLGDGPDAPRVLAEVSLAVMRICGAELMACRSFPDAVEVLKKVGLRVVDAAELLHLSRSAECSLRGKGIGTWREEVAGWKAPWATPSRAAGAGAAVPPPPSPSVSSLLGSAAGSMWDSAVSAAAGWGNISAVASSTRMRGSAASSRLTADMLEGAPAAPSLASPLATVAHTLRLEGEGARSSPVNIADSLQRLPLRPLPASPAPTPGGGAAMRALRSPLRSGGGTGSSSLTSPLRSPLARGAGGARAALPTAPPLATPLDQRSIASALNTSVAAASGRKRTRDASLASSLSSAAAAVTSSAASLGSAFFGRGGESTLQAAAAAAASALASALTAATPGSYAEYDEGAAEGGGGELTLTCESHVEEGAGQAAGGRGTKRSRTSPGGGDAPAAKRAAAGRQAVQLMMLSPPRSARPSLLKR
jgi:hypothetical protein